MALLDHIIHYCSTVTPLQGGIILSILFLYILHLFLRDLDVPPGPRGLPVIGYWPFLKTSTCHIQLKELAKKFGDVFSLRVTGKLYIHISSIKVVKEAHLTKADCFEGRFTDFSVLIDAFKQGLIFINGEQWKVLRRFFLQKFKEYGMNAVRENTCCSVYDSLRDMVEELHNTKGRPSKLMDLSASKSMTSIRKIIFNDGGITNEELKKSNELYATSLHALTSKNFLLMGNFARYIILPLLPTYRSAKRCNQLIEEIFLKVIERQKAEYDEKRPTNLIDEYFKERDDRKKRGDPTAAYFTDTALADSLAQFVTDGILSVGILVNVILSTLVERPEEQEKIYQEIMDVIGSARLPTIEDKTNLPYTNAFIYEVMRFSDFLPLYPSMECTKETTLNGYKIPKGAITLLNLYGMHRNPENYKNPDEFNPSRYLEKPRPELPVLFGIGKRNCIGEAFSMIEVFLLVTTVVQNFRLTYPDGSKACENMFWSKERADICAFPRSHK